ncbi:MAG: LON peptidase substrate-binding domain-containing protein [Bacteroidia bacterium]|jgi:Lon protease-like protein
MTTEKTLPIFPLSAVVLPGEELYLHIFEPRYKQLMQYAEEHGASFGIPFVSNKTLREYGSEVKLKSVFSRNSNGELDISVIGVGIFKLTEVLDTESTLYSQALVDSCDINTSMPLQPTLHQWVRQYLELKNGKPSAIPEHVEMSSFDAAVLLSLHPEKKYHLLELQEEIARQTWLINELKVMIQARKHEILLQDNFIMN